MKPKLLKNFLIASLVFSVSLLLRLPYFAKYPLFRSDELYENLWSYLIASEGFFPLTNTVPFIGALYNYLVAIFYMFLHSSWGFRLLAVLAGSITPVILYFVAYNITGSRVIGLLSSIILASTPPHVLVASHVAWSASLSPLFLTLSLYALWKSFKTKSKFWWVIAGITVGLTVQTHPSTIASYAGLALAALYALKARRVIGVISLGSIWCFIAGFLLGYINMVLYNILHPLHSVFFVFQAKWTGLSSGFTVFEYFRRLWFIVLEYFTMFPSGIPVITLPYHAKQPLFYVFLSSFIALTVLATVKSRVGRALAIYIATTLCVLAIGTRGAMTFNIFGFAWGPHYLQQLTPLTAFLLSLGVRSMWGFKTKHVSVLKKFAKTLLLIVVIFMIIVWPLLNMFGTLAFMDKSDYTNEIFLNAIYAVKKKFENIPVYVMYEVPYRDPALTTFHLVAVLEKINVYPKMNKEVIVGLREAALKGVSKEVKEKYVKKIIEESNREFLKDIHRFGKGILITNPKEPTHKALQQLKLVGFTIVHEEVVRASNILVYKVVVIGIAKTS